MVQSYDTFALFLSTLAFSQMLFCCVLLVPYWRINGSIRLFTLLMLCGCGYLLGFLFAPLTLYSLTWWLSHIGGNALPGVFWLVSLSLFGDHSALKRWQYLAASMTLVVPLFIALIESTGQFLLADYPSFYGLVKSGGLLFELVLIVHALIIAAHYWRDDLVKERRFIRGSVISISALYIFLVIVLEQLFDLQWSGLALLKSTVLLMLITGINFFLFKLNQSSLFESFNDEVIQEEVPQPSKELALIVNAMEVDKLYQQEGMTISSLAKHLGIHEYKLRQLINGEMNYRNFNDFLNFYRIKEVTENLRTPQLQNTPVLTLALDSGFRSLSSFNKAFKEKHGITPTEFRKKAISSQ